MNHKPWFWTYKVACSGFLLNCAVSAALFRPYPNWYLNAICACLIAILFMVECWRNVKVLHRYFGMKKIMLGMACGGYSLGASIDFIKNADSLIGYLLGFGMLAAGFFSIWFSHKTKKMVAEMKALNDKNEDLNKILAENFNGYRMPGSADPAERADTR